MTNGSTLRPLASGLGIAATLFLLGSGLPAFASTGEALPLPHGCETARGDAAPSVASTSSGPVFPPVQLEVHTPFEPSAFAAGGYNYLLYELHLQNFSWDPLNLHGLEVFDAHQAGRGLIASFVGPRFFETLVGIGTEAPSANRPLDAGRRAVFFVCLAFEPDDSVPEKLGHRVLLGDAVAEGPVVGARNGEPKVLGPPVSGGHWMAISGLGFSTHHRSGLFVAGGLAQISRRYAVDWKRVEDGAFFSGDALDVSAYYTYGEEVLAVADATVVLATDGFPDNIPRTSAGFETAVPITMETVAGNAIVLDLGDGQFASYAHLKPGSLRVKVGDAVQRGQPVALVGNSGDAREPHLHFQVTSRPEIFASEGVPYVIDRFHHKAADGSWQVRSDEFPLGGGVIDFSAAQAVPPDSP
jgi:hypothetical protein